MDGSFAKNQDERQNRFSVLRSADRAAHQRKSWKMPVDAAISDIQKPVRHRYQKHAGIRKLANRRRFDFPGLPGYRFDRRMW
jgi:hypothetical protein